MKSRERDQGSLQGPTYYDVSRTIEYLRERYDVGIDLVVSPPLYIERTGHFTSWGVAARAWRVFDGSRKITGASAFWGSRATWATFPAALNHALLQLQEKLEDDRL